MQIKGAELWRQMYGQSCVEKCTDRGYEGDVQKELCRQMYVQMFVNRLTAQSYVGKLAAWSCVNRCKREQERKMNKILQDDAREKTKRSERNSKK